MKYVDERLAAFLTALGEHADHWDATAAECRAEVNEAIAKGDGWTGSVGVSRGYGLARTHCADSLRQELAYLKRALDRERPGLFPASVNLTRPAPAPDFKTTADNPQDKESAR